MHSIMFPTGVGDRAEGKLKDTIPKKSKKKRIAIAKMVLYRRALGNYRVHRLSFSVDRRQSCTHVVIK